MSPLHRGPPPGPIDVGAVTGDSCAPPRAQQPGFDYPLASRRGCGLGDCGGFSEGFQPCSALVAQGIERRFPKPCVAGSNPAGGTIVMSQDIGIARTRVSGFGLTCFWVAV